MQQVCCRCKLPKDFSLFNVDKSKKLGIGSTCRPCLKEYSKEYRLENKEEITKNKSDYYFKNKDTITVRNKKWREDNKEKLSISKKLYHLENKDTILQKHKIYYQNNKEVIKGKTQIYAHKNRKKINKRAIKYSKKRRDNDPNFKLTGILRHRLWLALKGDFKSGSAVRDLGCTIEELKIRLESLFQPGMSWDNWGIGKGKWNLDHIIPLISFDLTDHEQLLKAVHYTNLQPLWATENSQKSDKLDWKRS